MGVYSKEALDEINNTNLVGLGVILLDTLDSAIADGTPEDIDEIYEVIGREVQRRYPAEELEHQMDTHYDKWKQLSKDPASFDQSNDAFYELKALMTGFQGAHK